MEPLHTATPPSRSRTLRLWLIIGSGVAALAILPAAMMGMMSVMASDSGVTSRIHLFIFVMLTFPLAIVLGPMGGWVAYGFRREKTAWAMLFSPFAWVVVIAVLTVVGLD